MWVSDSRSLVRNMTRSQPRFLLSGLHSTQPVDLQVYAWNKKGRSEAVSVVQRVIITSDPGSQSTGAGSDDCHGVIVLINSQRCHRAL